MVEYGIVKFFDGRDGKRFGFLQPCLSDGTHVQGKDIFFHYNDYGIVGFYGHFEVGLYDNDGVHTSRPVHPRKGDLLAFELQPARKGDKAVNWVPAMDYAAALEDAEHDKIGDLAYHDQDIDDETTTSRQLRSTTVPTTTSATTRWHARRPRCTPATSPDQEVLA